MTNLLIASRDFEIPQEKIDEIKLEQASFVSQFPIESLSDLTLSEYTSLGSRDSFTYNLEQKKLAFRIGGGSSSKFGIYEGRDHRYHVGRGNSSRELSGAELQEEFDRVKREMVTAIESVTANRVEDIKPRSLWPVVLQKILYFYFPDRFLSIGKKEIIEKCAVDLDLMSFADSNRLLLNYKCRQKLEELTEFGGWGTEKLSKFIWGYYSSSETPDNQPNQENIANEESEMSYFQELLNFLNQAQTNTLTHAQYSDNFMGLTVKVGFGMGTPAFVPWIAFLKSPHRVQDGIYPAFLYYKHNHLLVLSYCVSRTNAPRVSWNLPDLESIDHCFEARNLGTAQSFGNSFVYKVYEIKQDYEDLGLNKEEIDNDLVTLVKIYKEMTVVQSFHEYSGFRFQDFHDQSIESGLRFGVETIKRFDTSLMTKPFVILTGLSGSGKTKLAQAFAMWICESEDQYRIVPVGADWTNREPLLGFPNALKAGDYVKPDNGVVDLIYAATKPENANKPYFLILDEMNLSHVERYFSDFLSVMESEIPISLHSDGEKCDVPPKLSLPNNLFIVGTVNIDETTYMFSPKVLDRASVIEFSVNKDEMTEFLRSSRPVDLSNLEGQGAGMAANFLATAKDKLIKADETTAKAVDETLLLFFDQLRKVGAEFGYRTASEIKRFAAIARRFDTDWPIDEIVDAAIMQKLLPKVHGSRRKLEDVLQKLCGLCLKNEGDVKAFLGEKFSDDPNMELTRYPMSAIKVRRMYHNLMSNGFTSYAEA